MLVGKALCGGRVVMYVYGAGARGGEGGGHLPLVREVAGRARNRNRALAIGASEWRAKPQASPPTLPTTHTHTDRHTHTHTRTHTHTTHSQTDSQTDSQADSQTDSQTDSLATVVQNSIYIERNIMFNTNTL